MASASSLRSPLPPPPPPNSTESSCPFRRSRSRIFYDSEPTAGTSWEFRGVQLDSPSMYHEHQLQGQLQYSVLRSPNVTHNSAIVSPVQIRGMIVDSSSSVHHRSIPSPPRKDDLNGDGSDGSRNSTGSSTGSHRSHDSGFLDSAESRPSRRSLVQRNFSPNQNQPQLVLVSCNELYCSQVECHNQNQDQNKNYHSPSGQFILNANQNQSRNATFVINGSLQLNQQYEGIQEQIIYGQSPHNYFHERCQPNSASVPSPILHSGAGCGKLFLKSGSNFVTSKTVSLTQQQNPTRHQYPSGEYGEVNGNTVTECSNCIYQEVAMPNTNDRHLTTNSRQYVCHSKQLSNISGGSGRDSENYSVYTTVPSTYEQTNDQLQSLGTPVCSSTPKRSMSSNCSRATIMQKIDNFESLNKNMRSLDNNNNSSTNTISTNGGGIQSMSNSSLKPTTKSISFFHNSSHNSKTRTKSPSLSHQQQPHCTEKISPTCKKYSKNSPSTSTTSFNRNSSQQMQSISPNSTTVSKSGHNANKTVVSREALPLPEPPNLSSSDPNNNQNSRLGAENNNSFIANEFSTYSSQSPVKSCTKISPKWKSLPKGYKRVSSKDLASSFTSTSEAGVQTSGPDTAIIVKSHFDNDAMRLWLHELRSQTENECFYMLQTKSICEESMGKDEEKGSGGNASDSDSGTYGSQECEKSEKTKSGKSVVEAIHAISSPLMSIKNVEQMANVVSAEFSKICKNIEFGFLSQVPHLVINLVNYVEKFLRTFQGSLMFGNLQKLENKLSRSCRRLQRSAQVMVDVGGHSDETNDPKSIYSIIESETSQRGAGYHVAVSEVVDGIVTVGNLFSQVVDLRLTRDLSCILDIVEGGGVPAKVALKSFVTILVDGGNHLCRLASEIRTVRGLLGLILDVKDDYLRILSLRCLATVLCVGEAVKDFDRASGFEIVADFMYEPTYSFELKIEAVSVLTQATDPWIDLETSLSTLGSNLEKIIISLTNLIPDCISIEEPFLLVIAAISNLTFLETSSMEMLRRCGTVSLIINAIEVSTCTFSVFVYDHVATILANMAGVDSCRDCIVKSGGVHALLSFLQKRPVPSLQPASEIMACERVQQKSTIAISRLCGEEGVAQLILEKGGINRLIQLSRNEKERNYSDGVLIAALATLRKLVSICGDEVIRGLQADDLIQPRLLDSFLLYSSRQESYV